MVVEGIDGKVSEEELVSVIDAGVYEVLVLSAGAGVFECWGRVLVLGYGWIVKLLVLMIQ